MAAAPQTVCTLTINSPDEQEALRRHLPPSKYRFVELVQRGRPDWLASACRAPLRCDVLVVSAHFDGADAFYAERIEQPEHFTGGDLERVSCGGACPALFSQLQEVYLFGCNTLNPQPQSDAPAEVLRSLLRAGHTRAQAEQALQSLTGVHAESRRDRMRQIFQGVPVIYGFSGSAPLGPAAAATLQSHLRHGGGRDFGSGRVSNRLLEAFAPFGLAAAPGLADDPALVEARADMCRFADERLPAAAKLAFVHGLLQRHVGEARLYMDRIQNLLASLDDSTRRQSEVAAQLAAIAGDGAARERLLDYARRTDRPPVRVQMLDLAHDLGWLNSGQRRGELVRLLDELQQRRALGVPEVHLACALNEDRRLDGALRRPTGLASGADSVAHAALRACLGSADDRARTLQALLGASEADVHVAQAYLRHRPVADAGELRRLVDRIAGMNPGGAQVQALEALSRHPVADREVLRQLTRLFADSPSAAVQSAIAAILIRADPKAIDTEALTHTLMARRHPAPGSGALIDLLLDALQSR
ncbi:MAG: hypothetical protein C0505_15665 [Leptothrix sp. (in: Bacteria)]|nr:hypothetical protein [Leptothrix sp. (in: b-proteobacteria)]